jgi:hypothetical protein
LFLLLLHITTCFNMYEHIIVHLTLTTMLFILETFENNVLYLLQPYIIAFECLLHIFDATWYRCKVVISSIMLWIFDWTMWYFLRHWFLAHLAKGNLSYCHHLVRSASSSSVYCYCNILIFYYETLCQLNWNFAGSIFVRCSIKSAPFVPIR